MNSKSTTLAIPFITYNEGQGFSLSKEAEEFLLALPEERQLGIVSIVGKYRTGKSFFVNRVLLEQKKGGFQVGPTINPCTKGLWLWKRAFPSSSNEKMDIIMIDTEGFGGMDENANHDSRIFLFSLLLSSFFIYNSIGSIDENALNTLNLIINLAKDIQTKTNNRGSDDVSNFPAFLWVVRDFTLMLQDKNGNKINSKEYLENALELQKGSSDAIENKNKLRRHIKHFFVERDCQLMVRPTEREKDLQRLDEIDNSQLRPQFVAQVEAIRGKIFRNVKSKKVADRVLNGNLLVSLCKGYMEAINKGHLPNVQSAWFYVCRSEGLRAVKQANDFLEATIEQLIKAPINFNQLNSMKNQLREQVISKFKKRALGSQEGHPDLLERIEKRIQESFNDLVRKNKISWQQKYKQLAQNLTQIIKQKIYSDDYTDFSDFVKDFEVVKEQYDANTIEGDPIQKWKYFNQLSQNLYRLAGETITTKINKNLYNQKLLMQQRMQVQEEQLEEQQKRLQQEKDVFRSKIELLEKQNAKLIGQSQTHRVRAQQYKEEHDKLYDKYRNLYNEHEQTLLSLDKLKKQSKRAVEGEVQEAKNQIGMIKSTMQKQKALYEMEKKYIQEELERYKDRCGVLEGENRKLRINCSKITSQFEDIQAKYSQKLQELEILEQTNSTYSKKIENLMAQNSKRSQIINDHSEWMLQKSYLQNQISFLKTTLNQNKRLHDALLVALQQSLSTSEGENNGQLLQANKSLSSALQKMDNRCRVLEQKYEKAKELKKMMKNCMSMQCANCSKWIQPPSFGTHLQQCCGIIKQKTEMKQNFHISVNQAIIKQGDQRRKPYTEYILQISLGESKWKVSKRYKQFTELQQMLIGKFPGIKYPPSCNFLADINNLVSSKQRNVMSEQRRKSLQQYLRDLSKIEQIRTSDIFRGFLECEDEKEGKKYKIAQKDRLFF